LNFARSIAAGALVLGMASVAHAKGLTLKVEGGLGFVNDENVGIFSGPSGTLDSNVTA